MLDVSDTASTDFPTYPCTKCGTDLAPLASFARFCPRCGVRLEDKPPKPASPFERVTSVVVRGYANAMFRLGVHYEVRHNDDEAVRCYGKASRLGNDPAKARLIDIPLATVMADPPSGTRIA